METALQDIRLAVYPRIKVLLQPTDRTHPHVFSDPPDAGAPPAGVPAPSAVPPARLAGRRCVEFSQAVADTISHGRGAQEESAGVDRSEVAGASPVRASPSGGGLRRLRGGPSFGSDAHKSAIPVRWLWEPHLGHMGEEWNSFVYTKIVVLILVQL